MRTITRFISRICPKGIMINRLKPLKDVEDHRARICLEMVCEFMRMQEEEISTRDIQLIEFQQRV